VVLVADDHALIRTGMRLLLQRMDNSFDVVEVGTEQELHEAAERYKDNLLWLFLDLGMPGCKGASILERLDGVVMSKKICVLSAENNPLVIEQCLARGVQGFISKSLDDAQLTMALGQLLAGNPCYAGIEAFFRIETTAPYNLSKKQMRILQELAAGVSYEDIGRKMDITVHGVHYHAREIFRKLHVNNRQQAMAMAKEIIVSG